MQCQKLYWLERHSPEQKKVDDLSGRLKAMIKEEVETAAKELFPDAYVVRAKTVKAALEETKKAIAAAKETILNGMVSHQGVAAHIDVLKKEGGGYSVYEIKSSSGVKDVYFNEAAIKWSLLHAEKVPLFRSYILHINNRYTRSGALDIGELFTLKNVTQVVRRRQEEVIKKTDEILMIERESEPPEIHIGSWCTDPYECEFMHRCWKGIPKPSVFDLHMLPGKRKFELYRQGIVTFDEIPKDMPLRQEQKRQIEAELYNREFIDREGLASFLEEIRYPIHFLDFETYQQAIPQFDNLRPYEQIPFQFSLHIIHGEGEMPEHIEFLDEPGSDPRGLLAEKLAESIGSEGSIIAYNQSFEKSVIKRLAENYPAQRPRLLGMLHRFKDLMYPFERGLYYTREMNGRHSIKVVLPALVPELSYSPLNISHGGEAMNAYATLHLQKDPKEIDAVRQNLLEYCKLDTLAMVKIWEKLQSVL